jgi:hypothetical protein
LYLSPALRDRKQSIKAAMLEMFPCGEEKAQLVACLFPQEVAVFLPSRVDHKNPKLLAEEVEARWTLQG